SQSYPFSHSLGWSLSSGCSQAPIRVEGTIYSATEPVDTVLSLTPSVQACCSAASM
ncbi:mCG60674, isoform CRA_a, partial [Mus musculus]